MARKSAAEKAAEKIEKTVPDAPNPKLPYSKMLVNSRNIIFHGAPGTGKTYLAKQIAADIVSESEKKRRDYSELSDEQKKQIGFVQFHPSYDYTDFVEGLRPVLDNDSTNFELTDGIFKEFVDRARKNYENSSKDGVALAKENAALKAINDFITENINEELTTTNSSPFRIDGSNDTKINITLLSDKISDSNRGKKLNIATLVSLLTSKTKFEKVSDVTNHIIPGGATQQLHCYYYALCTNDDLKSKYEDYANKNATATEERKFFVFIIDEINRGEISKIFGELFYSIDPGYRGPSGAISTQYSNLHDDPDYKFYIPENLYIIGTMNDIDRSVDSFDFAMRRRFRFIEIKATDSRNNKNILKVLDEPHKADALTRMDNLNKAIANTPELNESYQIGAAYFLKLKEIDYKYNVLWEDYLRPLLQEYIRGMHDEKGIMNAFAEAYGYSGSDR